MENQDKRLSRKDNDDVDLGSALVIMGRGFRSIGRFFSGIFRAFGDAIVYALLFLKRMMWWLIAAVIIGLSLGSYLNYVNGPMYHSVMTARYNFGSTRALYNTIDYLNALISEDRLTDLSKALSISVDEAKSIKLFSATPLTSEKAISDLYYEYYLATDRRLAVRTDTFWTRTIRYKDFKEGLTKYDFPVQLLTAYSNRSDIFPKIQQGLINTIVSNGTLKRNEEINKRIQEDDEKLTITSIQGLDTLRQVYNERLRQMDRGPESGSANLTVLDKMLVKQNPELEVFDKFLQFKDELRSIRNSTLNKQEIVQVSASFNPVGRKVSILKQTIFTTTVQVVILALIILIIIEIYRALGSYERRKKVDVTA